MICFKCKGGREAAMTKGKPTTKARSQRQEDHESLAIIENYSGGLPFWDVLNARGGRQPCSPGR